jgi:hypothetical protein
MAPRMNDVLEKARAQGVFIIHAPSSCMKPYEGHPARQRAKVAPQAKNLPDKIGEWCKQIPAEEKAVYPIDQTDGGEDDDPAEHAAWAKELAAKGLNPRAPWTRQIDVLRIDDDKSAVLPCRCLVQASTKNHGLVRNMSPVAPLAGASTQAMPP